MVKKMPVTPRAAPRTAKRDVVTVSRRRPSATARTNCFARVQTLRHLLKQVGYDV
jgi:hypothetical protein